MTGNQGHFREQHGGSRLISGVGSTAPGAGFGKPFPTLGAILGSRGACLRVGFWIIKGERSCRSGITIQNEYFKYRYLHFNICISIRDICNYKQEDHDGPISLT